MTQATATSGNKGMICYIRRTKEWAEQYKISEDYQSIWNGENLAKIWNETFSMLYCDFRKELHQIQQENLKEVAFDGVLDEYEYYLGDERIVVPTDDDDWFHPDIISLGTTKSPVVYWNFVNYNCGVVSIQKYPANYPYFFESNNYALIKPENKKLLRYHWHADGMLRNKGLYIDACFTMHNRSIGSISLLKERLSNSSNPKQELLNLHELHKEPVKVVGNVPPYFMKYVNRMLDFYRNKLKVRKTLMKLIEITSQTESDKATIERLKGMCKFNFVMDGDYCTDISFHDDDSLFGGTIRKHPQKMQIMKMVAKMPYLKRLNIRKCKLGIIPDMASKNLEYIDISCNDLDVVPKWVTQQRSLKFLNLGANKICEIPDLSELPLEVLKLHKNKIAKMPSIGNKIKSLNLFINEMQDVPDCVLKLSLLEVFTFGVSTMKAIPSLSALLNLKWLTLSVNKIEVLPDDIYLLKNLEGLQLAKNRIIRLPDKIGDMNNLKAITLYSNDILQLPDSFFNLKLKKLNLALNPLNDKESVVRAFGNIDFIRI